MKNKIKVLRKMNLNWLLVGAIIFLVADPLGILGGNFSNDSYSQIRNELSKTKNAKVQLLASWDDFFSLEYNNYWRAEMNTEFVERGYAEILNAASLGDKFFNEYLNSKGVTHLLVPRSTEKNGRVVHKFGARGSIDILLGLPFFATVAHSSGPFASTLFQVAKNSQPIEDELEFGYLLSWVGVGSEFYSKKNTVVEVGMYRYDYNMYYENGPDVSWFYDQTPERPGYLQIKYESDQSQFKFVNLEIELVAAYGPNAPTHVVIVSNAQSIKAVSLTAGIPQKVAFRIADGQSIKFSNGTPCRVPSSFEPSDASLSKICFGVSAVRVTPVTQAE